MMTLEPPRTLSGKAGKNGQGPDAEVWRAWGLYRPGLIRFLKIAQLAVGLRGEVSVLLAGDRTLRRLNREYRGKDKATDVLSFPVAEEFVGQHGGDLAISVETAKRQAEEHGHLLRDEVKLLLLHGLLHLSGMDHETDRGEMAKRETELRGKLRLPNGLIARAEEPLPVEARTTAKAKASSRFPEGMTEKTATATAKAFDAKGAKSKRDGREGKPRSGVGA